MKTLFLNIYKLPGFLVLNLFLFCYANIKGIFHFSLNVPNFPVSWAETKEYIHTK